MEIGTKAQNLRAARIIYANPATLTGEMEGGIKISMLRVAFTHAAASAASDEGASGLLSSLGECFGSRLGGVVGIRQEPFAALHTQP